VLADVTALTPPFLVCAAFLTAVAAFLRHEMRTAKKQDDDQRAETDEPSRVDEPRRADGMRDASSASVPVKPSDY
jgi:hypothetical protein